MHVYIIHNISPFFYVTLKKKIVIENILQYSHFTFKGITKTINPKVTTIVQLLAGNWEWNWFQRQILRIVQTKRQRKIKKISENTKKGIEQSDIDR